MPKYNRRGTIRDTNLIDMILKDKSGCLKYSEIVKPEHVEIYIQKEYKDEMLFIEYKIDIKLFKKYKSLRKETKL